MVRTKRSAKAFRLGERAGSRTGVTPAAASVSRTGRGSSVEQPRLVRRSRREGPSGPGRA